MSTLAHEICPICGSAGPFSAFKLGLVGCAGCRVVLSPAVWRSDANETMEEEWFGETYKPYISAWVRWFEALNNRRTCNRLLAGVDGAKKRLLEIGVGSGSFLNSARDLGFEVVGCDLSPHICQRVQARYGIRMHCGQLDDFAAHERFDFLVMNHVLEHVHQPIQFLESARSLLKPGGKIHIAVPNVACWEAKLSGWTSFEPYHLVYFDPETLKETVTSAGLTMATLSTHDSFSGWFLAALRTLTRLNRGDRLVEPMSAASRQPRAKSLRNYFLEHAYRLTMVATGCVLWPLRKLQALLGRGDEIICIAQRASN